MSKIAVAGNASGTGVFTIASPNSNTDRTLTLPDETGTVLTSASSISISQLSGTIAGTGPVFSAKLSADQTIASSSTWTKLLFNLEDFDVGSCYDNSSNYRFTPNVAGYYQVNFTGAMETLIEQNNNARISIYKNGSSYRETTVLNSGAVGLNNSIGYVVNASVSMIVSMNGSTDYLEVWAYQTYGSNALMVRGNSTFSACLVRGA